MDGAVYQKKKCEQNQMIKAKVILAKVIPL